MHPRPFFPGIPAPIEIRGDDVQTVKYALEKSNEALGLVLVRDPDGEGNAANIHRVGTAAKIMRAVQTPEGSAHILVNCLKRFTVEEASTSSTA